MPRALAAFRKAGLHVTPEAAEIHATRVRSSAGCLGSSPDYDVDQGEDRDVHLSVSWLGMRFSLLPAGCIPNFKAQKWASAQDGGGASTCLLIGTCVILFVVISSWRSPKTRKVSWSLPHNCASETEIRNDHKGNAVFENSNRNRL